MTGSTRAGHVGDGDVAGQLERADGGGDGDLVAERAVGGDEVDVADGLPSQTSIAAVRALIRSEPSRRFRGPSASTAVMRMVADSGSSTRLALWERTRTSRTGTGVSLRGQASSSQEAIPPSSTVGTVSGVDLYVGLMVTGLFVLVGGLMLAVVFRDRGGAPKHGGRWWLMIGTCSVGGGLFATGISPWLSSLF